MELPNNYELQKGKYRITGKIGQGGFGITYRALWQTVVSGSMGEMNTTVPVAIKEFFFEEYCSREAGKSDITITSATGRDLFEKFKNKLKKEAAILSKLRHPNIVRVLDVFEENNTAYIVMAFIEGRSLKEMIAENGKLNEETALKYAGQLCDALTEIHHHKILHLDIKPGNILIDKDDNVQLIDFGISKQYNDLHQETSTTPVGISKGFAPYEQYSGVQEFTPATDVYALGATLYYMLTAQVPTESICHIDEPLTPVRELAPQVSMPTERTIIKAMNIRRTDRQQAVSEFKNELVGSGSAVDERTVVEHKTPVVEKPEVEAAVVAEATEEDAPDRSKRMIIIIGVAILLIVVGISFYLSGRQDRTGSMDVTLVSDSLVIATPTEIVPEEKQKSEQEEKNRIAREEKQKREQEEKNRIAREEKQKREQEEKNRIAREEELNRHGVVVNGIRWAKYNVASPGTFAARPESPGMFYQWNRRKAWNATGEVSNWDSSEPTGNKWAKANDPCPAGWRVPTHNEFVRLDEAGSIWTKVNGVPGRQFGSGSNSIFLPASGIRNYNNGAFNDVGSSGWYWAASIPDNIGGAYNLYFGSVVVNPRDYHYRPYGFSVRCAQE